MDNVLFPVLLVVIASFFQGTFGLGMKYVRPLAWEAWWLLYSVVAMILIPVLWAVLAVPHLWQSIAEAPGASVWSGTLFGFLWGVGGILFGLSVRHVGVSLTYGIVMGPAASVGSLVPLASVPRIWSNPALPFIVAGVALMLAGVAIAAWAGVLRDQAQNTDRMAGSGEQFRKGLAIAISSGVLSALLNVGFADAAPVARRAAELGAATRNSSLAAWVVVLFGAFLMNAGYAGYLLVKNRSLSTYRSTGAGKAVLWSLTTGVLWFAALGIYGQGAALMGSLGPVVGWPMLLGLALIVSNLWSLRAGEWKAAPGAFRWMQAGVAVLIVACGILGYSNSLL